MVTEQSLRTTLSEDPGNPVFADLVGMLIADGRLDDAILASLRGLSANPECHKGRLLFAHALFRAGFVPFSAREVKHLLHYFPSNESLRSLLGKLEPTAVAPAPQEQNGAPESEIADVEFDIDAIDDLGKK